MVDALLVPMLQTTGSVAPMLVTDPAALDQADPLAPVLPINAARAASQLTMTGHREKLGVVLRSCEIRALVELVKFQQAKLDERRLHHRRGLPGDLRRRPTGRRPAASSSWWMNCWPAR